MYGMIHRAVRQMVLDGQGEATWAEIERAAGLGPAEMISAEVYDDEVTLKLIGATSEILAEPVDDLLLAFGRYWISFAERGSFGRILDFTGTDLISFIGNLDNMHKGVQAVMPDARMPTFKLLDATPGRLIVSYASTRTGLERFVEGLLLGLLDRFGHTGSVSAKPANGHGRQFLLTYAPA